MQDFIITAITATEKYTFISWLDIKNLLTKSVEPGA